MTFKVTSRSAKVHDVFVGEGYFTLCLPIEQLVDLQDLTDSGPELILARLRSGHWRVDDIRETLRLALIGGGLERARAHDLVTRCIRSGELLEYKLLAATALQAALMGPEEDPVGEPSATPTNPETKPLTPSDASAGQESTPSEEPRATRRKKSAK